ncbi:uncharacterized protein LOC126792603 isoform X2 [Argentina anserina]|uniref:uncharacterized protein LOC126792603 isoform X2 n=1 Tax=Argentina anserina TaxID=57926 RepID=UPI0021764BFB|nr:uncharacterized protein LOC126792603 isoform X2 [Potentilla anserina]
MIAERTLARVPYKMQEGSIYDIFCFPTQRDPARARVVEHHTIVYFNAKTQFVLVSEPVAPIPLHSFHLLEFNQLLAEVAKQEILTDVYGCIKDVVPQHIASVRSEKKTESKCVITLHNSRRETLKITLWGDVARQFPLETVLSSEPSKLAVITSLKLSTYYRRAKGSNTNHTCIIIDPTIPQREEYKTEFSGPDDKVKMLPIPFRCLTAEEQDQQARIKLSELNALNPEEHLGEPVYVVGKIIDFSDNGWWYKGCPIPECFKVLKKKEENNKYNCPDHLSEVIPLPCYKVYMIIEDDTNESMVTLMGRPAEELFGASCRELLNRRFYASETELPEEITNTIGQTHLFEIKMSYNSEFSVKDVHQAPQSTQTSGHAVHPTAETPERLNYGKNRIGQTTEICMFTPESEKKNKGKGNKHASSSPTGQRLSKQKMN